MSPTVGAGQSGVMTRWSEHGAPNTFMCGAYGVNHIVNKIPWENDRCGEVIIEILKLKSMHLRRDLRRDGKYISSSIPLGDDSRSQS